MEPLRGLEPRTHALQVRCSTTELKRLVRIEYPLLSQRERVVRRGGPGEGRNER